jgi:hypothetical protein
VDISNESQLELNFDSQESPEIINLIQCAKIGDENAWNILYAKYKDLIHGKYVQKIISFQTRNSEDNKSILSVLFVEAVHSYNGNSKFSTYLVNMIKWKFREKIAKERLIAAPVFKKDTETTNKIIKRTRYKYIDEKYDCKEKDAISQVNINMCGIQTKMDTHFFFTKFILPRLKDNFNKKQNSIIEKYFELILLKQINHSSAITKIAKRRKTSNIKINKIIQQAIDISNKEIKKENITRME